MSKYGLSSCSFSDRMSLVDHMQISIGNGNSPIDWMPIAPHCFQWPQALVGNVTWADEDL